ncbi:hypothetical protein Poli38472_013338 [Pythium oligandrum]|uniref:Uncharacterized protein n=1 Tax=Pythium oligandrum TaxID=41045 RepID=A0A8K1C756_PYTOL|nr:hypothetical protein Poli38472_013338 [Pythium oligandrum]|eukprot:TMW57864.1 hypothetical protein Poli38472_013338 [Pythium oligandrum]
MPLVLIVNYSLLQYLVFFYLSRQHERRIQMLFFIGILGVICVIPFANNDNELVMHLNDVSESCCVLTFLLQITIIGYDVNKKLKLRSVKWLTYLAELLIIINLASVLFSISVTFNSSVVSSGMQALLPNICENVTLVFIFAFRFYYVIMSRGRRDLLKNRKIEFTWYLLFATHEMPFVALESVSGLSWDFVQALYHRVTLAGCLFVTAHGKLRNRGSESSVAYKSRFSSVPRLEKHATPLKLRRVSIAYVASITIVGHDMNKKIKFRTIQLLTQMAEWLTAVKIFVAILSITCAFCPDFVDPATEELIPTITDNFTQLFLFIFRVYCLAASHGWRGMIQSRKAELFCVWLPGRPEWKSMADASKTTVMADCLGCRLTGTATLLGLSTYFMVERSKLPRRDLGQRRWLLACSAAFAVADWSSFTPERMNTAARQVFLPLVLMVNYSLLQYLVFFYRERRYERRIQLLLFIGLLGVICVIPFANPDDDLVMRLNDVSESCCVLTFLVQITIIGYDVNKKLKLRSVKWLTYLAEGLIAIDLGAVILSFVVLFFPSAVPSDLHELIPNICENATLVFIFAFRFYYVVMSRGWRDILMNRKTEFVWYLLFSTHEMPFGFLDSASGVSWEFVQALYHRITLAGCLFVTARGKLRSRGGSEASVAAGPSRWSTVQRMKSHRTSISNGRTTTTYVIPLNGYVSRRSCSRREVH